MTAETLKDRLDAIRRRIRRLVWVYGASSVALALVGGLLAAGLVDWLTHVDQPRARLVFGLAIVAVSLWVGWRFLVQPLLQEIRDVDLGLWIERRYPEFRDSLASTIEFLGRQHDPEMGSPRLQREVVEQTLRRAEAVDPDAVVGDRLVRRRALAAAGLGAAALILIVMAPVDASIALKRLAFPYSAGDWPKATVLQLVGEDFKPLAADVRQAIRVAEGSDFAFYVENGRGQLPDDVQLEFRTGRGRVVSQSLRRVTLRDDGGRERRLAAATLAAIELPMQFRAVGGDDHDMHWHRLQPVPPPVLERLSVTVTPPAYTRRPAVELPTGIGDVQAVVGSRIEVRARASKPLKSARIAPSGTQPQDAQLDATARELAGSFTLEHAGEASYRIILTDRDDFTNAAAPRYELRGIEDLAPELSIARPVPDLTVTAAAIVPIQITARDDVGLRGIRFRFAVNDTPVDQSTEAQVIQDFADGASEATVDYAWQLAPLALESGTRLTYRAEATDFYDLGPEHVGLSPEQNLTIVSAEEKLDELSVRQRKLADELESVRDSQAQTRDRTIEIGSQLADDENQSELNRLKRVEVDQRQLSAALTDPRAGLEAIARGILSELVDNGLESQEVASPLQRIADEVAALRNHELPAIDEALAEARARLQTVDATPDDRASASAAIAVAAEKQQSVLSTLGSLVSSLAQWHGQQDLSSALDEVIGAQGELKDRTAEIGRRTLTKSAADLSAEERADLDEAAGQQREIAAALEELSARIGELAESLTESDAAAAESVRNAAEEAGLEAMGNSLREAATQLQNNDVGKATTLQQQALERLERLQDRIASQHAATSAGPSNELATAAAALREEQDAIREQTRGLNDERAARGNWSRSHLKALQDLEHRQRELNRETAELAETAAGTPIASTALRIAAEEMRHAADQIAKREAGGVTQEAQLNASQRLEQIAAAFGEDEHSENENDQGEQQQSQDGKTPPREEIRLLRAMQEDLLRRTAAVEGKRVDGTLPPESQQELEALSAEQERLAQLTAAVLKRYATEPEAGRDE